MVRRDRHGLTHWANPPTPAAYHSGTRATGAFCDSQMNVYGDLISVPQSGPTCLWCLVVQKR